MHRGSCVRPLENGWGCLNEGDKQAEPPRYPPCVQRLCAGPVIATKPSFLPNLTQGSVRNVRMVQQSVTPVLCDMGQLMRPTR